jgi:hypothetical protein
MPYSIDRMIRRLISAVAAVALVYAMAAPPLAACERAHGVQADVAGAVMQGSSEGHAAHQSDCPESDAPKSQEHDSNCLLTCLTMLGCSAPSFVVEAAPLSVTGQGSPTPANSMQPHPSRSFAPDRPPPRV